MFNGNKKEMESQVDFDVIIGSNTRISGNIDSEGSIRIDGLLNGDINASGNVIIGSNAEINGNINSNNIDISGLVNGNINATNTLKIYESGRLNGDFECSNFHISDGGFFSGSCTVKGNLSNQSNEDNLIDLDISPKNRTENNDDKVSEDDDSKLLNSTKKIKKNYR